jgi:hypothetical protein
VHGSCRRPPGEDGGVRQRRAEGRKRGAPSARAVKRGNFPISRRMGPPWALTVNARFSRREAFESCPDETRPLAPPPAPRIDGGRGFARGPQARPSGPRGWRRSYQDSLIRTGEPRAHGCATAKRRQAASPVRRRRVSSSALAPPPPVISLFDRILSLFWPINSLFGANKFAAISTIGACCILYNLLKRLIIYPTGRGRKRDPLHRTAKKVEKRPAAVRAMAQAASRLNQPSLQLP